MKALTLLKGIGIGAGLMYLFDPERGHRRRALLRDQVVRTGNQVTDAIDATVRDVSNRLEGVRAGMTSLFESDDASDTTVAARVRSRMGHVVSNPHAIEVIARNGRVTLSGRIPVNEVNTLLECVRNVRGVIYVEDHLEIGPQSDFLLVTPRSTLASSLIRPEGLPSPSVWMGLGGGILALYGRERGGPLGAMLGLIGSGLVARALTDARLQPVTVSHRLASPTMTPEDAHMQGLLETDEPEVMDSDVHQPRSVRSY